MFYGFPQGYHFYQLAVRYGLPTYHDIVALPVDPFHPLAEESSYQRVLPILPTNPSDNRRHPATREQLLAAMQREAELLQIRNLDRPFAQYLSAANDRARQVHAAQAYEAAHTL
ncbi:MAG: hypothetical protein WCC10_07940 [Tumebacillaceae bacterium]